MVGKTWKRFTEIFKKSKPWRNDIKDKIDVCFMNITALSIKLEGYRKEQDDIKKVYTVNHDRIDEIDKKIDSAICVYQDSLKYEKHLRKEQSIRLEKRLKEHAFDLVKELEKDTKEAIHVFTEALKIRMHALENLEKRIINQAEEQKNYYELIREELHVFEKIADNGEKHLKKCLDKCIKKLNKEIGDCDVVQQVPRRLASIETRITLLEAK